VADELIGFSPDWTLAPAVTLREWMAEHGVAGPVAMGRAINVALPHYPARQAEADVSAVLGKEPMPARLWEALGVVTGASAEFWRNLEWYYRDGLARGLKDVTDDDMGGEDSGDG
jgi:hypothetical protein